MRSASDFGGAYRSIDRGDDGIHERAFEPIGGGPGEFHERAFETAPRAAASRRTGAADRVSVVVAARNYGRYLASCLHSVHAQTTPAAEVLYADDGSDDDSLAVARAFEPHGLKVLALPRQGVAAARNAGARAATGELLLFVDGDNLLAPDFIERHAEALADDAAFAYGSKHFFGRSQGEWEPGEWDRDRLWAENFVDTSSLVRREWFEAAGGWRENAAGTLWDWNLWLRVSRFGPGRRSGAKLYYRHHGANVSARVDTTFRESVGALRGLIRRSAVRVAVVLAFSGRLASLLPAWLEAVAAATSATADVERPELIVLDDSPEGFLTLAGPALARLDRHFAAVKVVRVHEGGTWRERRPDRAATARFLSVAYHRAGLETQAEVLWYIEDDILVPDDAFDRLLRALLDGRTPRAAAAGLYRSRHEPFLVLSRVAGGAVVHAEQAPALPGPCDLTGTGCLMVFRPLAKAVFRPVWHVPGTHFMVPAHDWAYTWQLREAGQPVWVDPAVVCRHYVNETEWV